MSVTEAIVFCERLADGQPPAPVLDALLTHLGGFGVDLAAGTRVLIKPNFVAPFAHATTDLEVIDFFVTRLREAGAVPVLGESSGFEFDTEAAFAVLGVGDYARRRDLELVDFEHGRYVEVDLGDGLGGVEVAEAALEAQLILNLPIIKGHTVTRVTGAVKNLFGLLSKPSRRRLHGYGLERGIAALAGKFPQSVHFVDARRRLARAVFAEAEPLGYVLAGRDPFALDHLGASLLGFDPASVGHLRSAPAYEIRGVTPELPARLDGRNSLRERVHRGIYSAFYWLDQRKVSLVGGESILPDLHWYLGVHPVLAQLSRAEAEAVAASCPVGAIDVEGRRIVKQECRRVRCLRCYREHEGLVQLGGLNRPRQGGNGDRSSR